MGSQLISNAVRSFFLAMVLKALLTGSVAEAASYQKRDGTTVDPILDVFGSPHSYRRSNLKPYADLTDADLDLANLYLASLYNAILTNANLYLASLYNAKLHNAYLSYANLTNADLYSANLTYTDLYSADLTDA